MTEKQIAETNLKFYRDELRDYSMAFDYCPENNKYYDYFLEKLLEINDKIDFYEKQLIG